MSSDGPIPRDYWTSEAEKTHRDRALKREGRLVDYGANDNTDSTEISSLQPEKEHQHWAKEASKANRMKTATRPVVETLKSLGSASVFATPGVNYEDIQFGLTRQTDLGETQLWLPADGFVQGDQDPNIDIDEFSRTVSELRREKGLTLLGFYGVDFGPEPGLGTEGVLSRVGSLMIHKSFTPISKNGLAIVGIGDGTTKQFEVYDKGRSATETVHFPDLLRGRYVYGRGFGIRPASLPVSELPSTLLIDRDIPSRPGLTSGVIEFGPENTCLP